MKTEYQMLVSGGMDVEAAITALTKQMGEWINKGTHPSITTLLRMSLTIVMSLLLLW